MLTYDRRGCGASALDGQQDDDERLRTDADDVARLIAREGGGPAFVFGSSPAAERGDAAQTARDFGYWFEHELRQYRPMVFDLEALRSRDGLAFIAGQDTGKLLPHRLASVFANHLGVPLHVLPGGHVGYLAYPAESARALVALLH